MAFRPIIPTQPLADVNKITSATNHRMRNLGFEIRRGVQHYPRQRTSYRRTGRLGQSWTTRGPFLSAGSLVVEVGNVMQYASYVQGFNSGPLRQRYLFRSLGWPSVEDVSEQELSKAISGINAALQGL